MKNLLDVSRLESGALKPKLDWCDLGDVIEGALAATREARRNHPVSVSLPPDYPLVKADFSLMEQVLVNLLLNACVHTPEGTSVTLQGGADPCAARFGWIFMTWGRAFLPNGRKPF